MTDPLDGLRAHGRRTPPSLDPVRAAGARRRRQAIGWASGGVTAAVVAVALVVTSGSGPTPSPSDRLGSGPTATTSFPSASPSDSPTAPAPTSSLAAAAAAHVSLAFPVGTGDGLYGIERVGDTGTSGFRVVRVDPATLAVQRSDVVPGTGGGLAVDNQAVYATAVGGTSVLRFAPSDLAPLAPWRDPLGRLAGPVVTTRSGLWVADARGLTRLVGDGDAPAGSAERSPSRILLAAGYSTPDVPADDFWAVALDDKDCPTLYRASGPDGLGGTRSPVFQSDCGLGLTAVVATSGGVMVSTPTGTMGSVRVLTPATPSGWAVASGPSGSNSITPSAAGSRLFASYQGELMCLAPDGRTLATVPVPDNGIAQVVGAGGRDLLVRSGTVEPFTPDPACR